LQLEHDPAKRIPALGKKSCSIKDQSGLAIRSVRIVLWTEFGAEKNFCLQLNCK
jgi:hypothetical protein